MLWHALPEPPGMSPEDTVFRERIQKSKYHVIHSEEGPKLEKVTEAKDNLNSNAEWRLPGAARG